MNGQRTGKKKSVELVRVLPAVENDRSGNFPTNIDQEWQPMMQDVSRTQVGLPVALHELS